MSTTPNPGSTASSLWETTAESRNYFSHAVPIQVGLGVMICVAFSTIWLMMQLPFATARLVVSSVPTLLAAYLMYRLYLSLCSVEFFEDHVEIRLPGIHDVIRFDAIKQIRFDSFSHDLIVTDEKREYRIPRTIQGHRVILHRLHAKVEVERDHSPEMQVLVRMLPRAACVLSILAMATLALMISTEVPQVGILLLACCGPAAYMLLDQCILRSYRFTPDALHVGGIWGTKVYARNDLKDTWITKSWLSSRFQMTFSTGTVQFDEYLLSKALIQVSGYVERRWQHRVAPLSERN